MNVATHRQMHADHANWLKEDDLWRDDIRAWQSELKKAIGEIDELHKLLKKHEVKLQKHAASVRAYEQATRNHEHALAEHERGETDADLVPLAPLHGQEAANHAEQHTRHEWLKRSHHTLMATWNTLFKALREPE
jgi:hypothetical protein